MAPSVAGRVDVHMAGYRKAYEGRGRMWLTLDGREIFSVCEFQFENQWRTEGRREGTKPYPFSDSAYKKIRAAGALHKSDLLDAMGKCIGGSVSQLLASQEPLVRALAMLDRRLGKRRLAEIEIAGEHPLVAQMYRVRCEAEGLQTPQSNFVRGPEEEAR